jgi:uncharacterized protein YjiK
MKKNYFKLTSLLVMLLVYSFSEGQNLLHYWNFNNNASVATITAPSQTAIAGASLTANLSGITAVDAAGGTGQNFNVLNLNARNSDASGTHLRFNDPIGSSLVFSLPTTGYENAVIKFATRRSGSGAGTQVWSYSTDGTNFTFFANVTPNNGDPALATLDFSAVTEVDNNSNFKLKVEFQQGAGGTVGNNRFDNFTAEGTVVVGGDTTAPTVAFLPLQGAINVSATTNPTLTFDENVRLLDNSAITNANIDAVIELRLDNSTGALVSFDATFASNTITINPTSDLANNQVYYVALLPNTIEDTSDNAISTTQSASFTTSNPSTSTIDLSTYVRVGRYDLPEPTRTAHPVNNLLCQEASAVAYNWDTDTLFITADGSTSVTQVSKTGVLIDTMTMAQGASPQGTEFYDTEGITYIGNGQFVMSEERDRQLVKFTYAAGTTLTRANSQTVKIGTFVPNTGTEGLCYDPLTGGYIVLKEISPIGIFQTNVDFAAGTATNGSATTENSINLFDPALLGFSDVADVFVLANLPSQSTSSNLLVLGQENAQVVNVDRNGNISSTLTIVSDAGNPLNAASQQHEGITMDNSGNIYIVNENGGGDIDHPQLWVYAPSSQSNQAPTALALTNTVPAIIENSITTPAVRVADLLLTDDGLGTNTYSLSGADAASFQITGSSLFVLPGTVLDFETKSTYNVTVNVDDTNVGTTPDASVDFVLSITDLVNETPQLPNVTISEVAPWGSGNSPAAADWFEVTNNGATALDISGWKVDDSSNSFAASLALTGITSIAPGESVIFLESSLSNPAATVVANFKSLWFGSNPPAGLQVGTYQGTGIGLSTSGDAVNLYDTAGVQQANVVFGVSPTTLYKTFNNAIGLANTTISVLSEVNVNDAFVALNDANEIGSPGSVGRLFISEVAPWSSGNSPVAADWFEVTNTKAVAVDISGWKVDDNSQSPIASVPLNGITSINPGESVIFIETTDLPTKTTSFLNTWFGTNPTGGLRIGSYTGCGGLGTGGDQVNLYNSGNVLQTSVLFGLSPAAAPYTTFDNKAGVNSLVTPITQFSAVSINGAFIAANDANEIGSPGAFFTTPCPTITASATPALSTVCFGATTSVTVTATGGTLPYVVSGSPLIVGGGTFNYTITDAKGCTTIASATIAEIALITYYADADGDGYGLQNVTQVSCTGAPAGYALNFGDCNDAVAAINPGHVEVLYNGVDDNCDGQFDEGFQLTTTLQAVSCGASLATLGSIIYAEIQTIASAYRFKVVNNATGEIQYYDSARHWFGLNMLPSYDYATTYTVSVQLQKAGVWLGYYGAACTVSTPAVLAVDGPLQLNPSQCGSTLASIGSVIAVTPLSGATGYRFRVTDVTPGAIGDNLIQVKNRSYHWFTLPMLNRFNYGSTYMVEVAVKTTSGYSGYGNACYITTPAAPVLTSCGTIVPTAGSLVYTSSLNSVSQYRFQVTNVSDQSTVTFDTNKFWFSFRVNVPGYTPETGYSVRVAVMTGGTWSAFGDACEIVSPAAAARGEVGSSVFEAVAFPNPFATEFKLNVTTSTEGAIALKVYDMLGKLIETRSINTIDYSSEDLGSAYPAGVYNVIVTQGENVKSLRMIKR